MDFNDLTNDDDQPKEEGEGPEIFINGKPQEEWDTVLRGVIEGVAKKYAQRTEATAPEWIKHYRSSQLQIAKDLMEASFNILRYMKLEALEPLLGIYETVLPLIEKYRSAVFDAEENFEG